MPIYRKMGRSLMEMNRGKNWKMWSRYPEMSTDLLGMANYTGWCSAQSVVIRWFRLPRQSGYWLQRESGDSLCDTRRERSSSQFWSLWGIIDRLRRNRAEEVLDEELEAPRDTVRDDEERDLVDHDMAEPQRQVDPPKGSFSQERTSMGSWSDSGCGEIWCPRRVSQGQQETSYIF